MKRVAAAIGLTWLAGALASVFRRRPRCKCGKPSVDDGLGFGLCEACQREEWEAPESGPVSLRPVELSRRGIGR
jgi:hypothetical protein